MNMSMNGEYVVQGGLAMTRGSLLRIEDGRGLLLYVWEGELWLTQEGERRDTYLAAGGWFRLERDGNAVAQALSRTVVSITAPTPEHYAQRIALTRAGTDTPVEIHSAEKARPSFATRLQFALKALA
jgi:hypothetical protein